MNEDMPQNAFSNQKEAWLLDHLGEIGERQGGDLEKRDGTFKEETEMLCNRSTGSSSSGTEKECGRGCPHGHESDDSSAGKSGDQNGSRSSQRNQRNEEMMMLIEEMKRYLPAERGDCCSKPSTLSALQYALKCVWQVQGNSQILPTLSEPGTCRTGTALYNLEELAAVTSEYASKNTDTIVVVFSLLSGQTMHVSEQAAGILNCKKRFLDTTPFAQLLAPQDMGIFYARTSQTHLPLWNTEAQTASVYERAQVKSFFCRLRGGKDQDQERRYYPFRITPYLVNVCVSNNSEPESCCLALAEKIHSGYEAPRIPLEKRIFTTMHSPGCVFLETDDRAVPLLGYLPQDLIGTSILMYLHPDDQPLMVAVHRKVLRFAGQAPFEHSPVRFCTQNGDYVVLDTSWSSFVNPWSRKIAFIIGRHKVRTSPLNEDVFAARSKGRSPVDKEVWELQGQIYKMLLQPIHSHGSSGYGSLVSNASYEHYISVASSSDSNGHGVEELPREPQVFVDINRLKHVGQQLYIESHSQRPDRSSRAPSEELPRGKESTPLRLPDPATGPQHHRSNSRGLPTASSKDWRSPHGLLSYQQINSMDSIIRYLEGCNIPALKRKCESSADASSSSDEDKQEGPALEGPSGSGSTATAGQPVAVGGPEEEEEEEVAPQQVSGTALGPPMADLALVGKALSAASGTSQCSYSSTLVHFPHPESEATALEEVLLQGEATDTSPAHTPGGAAATSPATFATTLEEPPRQVGLTKEVLSAHTQKEEQNYVDRFHQRLLLLPPYHSYFEHRGAGSNPAPSQDQGDFPGSWYNRSAPGKFGHQRSLASSKSSCLGSKAVCQKRGAVPAPPSWFPPEGSPPGPSGQSFPAPTSAAPCFPLDSPGGSQAFPWAAPAVPSSLPSIVPALPFPSAGHLVAVFVHPVPGGTLFPQAFPLGQPQPCLSPAFPCPTGPLAPLAVRSVPDPQRATEPVRLPPAPVLPKEEPPPLLSQSRSSSPLQLNLLQEELPKTPDPPSKAPAKAGTGDTQPEEEEGEDSSHHDGHSVSSELFDLLMLEDSQSGTGSATSGSGSARSVSLASASNGTSGCGTGSRNSSTYFTSSDSSEVSKRGRRQEEEKGPSWPARRKEEVLREDLARLAAMEKHQPRFSEEQKQELAKVHPWILTQTLPQEINTRGCTTCDSGNTSGEAAAPEDGSPPEEDGEDRHLRGPLQLPPEAWS
uniref:Period circadian protein homolog 3 isoform X2 n=1 Tax=Pogona vitticeps TaxID=103695 RepID=A0ABM5EKY6_9SAUR